MTDVRLNEKATIGDGDGIASIVAILNDGRIRLLTAGDVRRRLRTSACLELASDFTTGVVVQNQWYPIDTMAVTSTSETQGVTIASGSLTFDNDGEYQFVGAFYGNTDAPSTANVFEFALEISRAAGGTEYVAVIPRTMAGSTQNDTAFTGSANLSLLAGDSVRIVARNTEGTTGLVLHTAMLSVMD